MTAKVKFPYFDLRLFHESRHTFIFLINRMKYRIIYVRATIFLLKKLMC